MGQVAPWPRPGTETFVGHSELRAGGPAGNTALALKALGVAAQARLQHRRRHVRRLACRTPLARPAHRWKRAAQADGHLRRHRASRRRTQLLHRARKSAEQTAEGILDMLPATGASGRHRAAHRRVPLSGPARRPSTWCLTRIGQRGFAVALDTGWPPGRLDGRRTRPRQRLARLLLTISCSTRSNACRCRARLRSPRPRAGSRPERNPARCSSSSAAPRALRHGQAGRPSTSPAPAVDVIDTTGAGDAFNAGYLAARLRGAADRGGARGRRRTGVGGDRIVAAGISPAGRQADRSDADSS